MKEPESTAITWYVYILRCADGSFYTGVTTDLDRRLEEHNSGGVKSAKYTRARLPVRMIYHERMENRSLACQREAAIKRMSKLQKGQLLSL